MMIMLLGYVFLAVFSLTALLTLLSIPGWIEIPEKYRDTLFKALIIEVVGVVITLFSHSYLSSDTTIEIVDKNDAWVAIDVNTGSIITPVFTIHTNDSVVEFKPQSSKQIADFKFIPKVKDDLLTIYSNDSVPIGDIPLQEITRNRLFNSIKSSGGTISSINNYSLVKFQKDSIRQKWKRIGDFLKNTPFQFALIENDKQAISYEILKGDTTVFYSNTRSESLFDVDNRLIHIYEDKGTFHMFRITEADLISKRQYVNVLQIRLEPEFK